MFLLAIFVGGFLIRRSDGLAISSSSSSCTLCVDGSEATLPSKKVIVSSGYPEMKCSSIETMASRLFTQEDSQCLLLQRLSSLCGCPTPEEDSCSLCADGSSLGTPDTELLDPLYSSFMFPDWVPTCELVEAYLHSVPQNDELCTFAQQTSQETCACTGFDGQHNQTASTYTNISSIFSFDDEAEPSFSGRWFGISSQRDLNTLYSVSRASSLLSLIGAMIVLQDCVRKKRVENVYNQIIATMAVNDILFSTAAALGDSCMGNIAACKVQGFFIQMGGMTNVFLNASLSTYYLLVIIHSTKRTKLCQFRKWLIGTPLSLGIILAAGSVPFVTTGVIGCHLTVPISWIPCEVRGLYGLATSYAPILVLELIPACLVVLFCTIALIRVVLRMRQVDRKSIRWRFFVTTQSTPPSFTVPPEVEHQVQLQHQPASSQNDTTRRKRRRSSNSITLSVNSTSTLSNLRSEVFWQSSTYLLVLYATWLLRLVIIVEPERYITSHFELWVAVFFWVPLQGFLNAMCYFRPRASRFCRKWSKSLDGRCSRPEVPGVVISDAASLHDDRSSSDPPLNGDEEYSSGVLWNDTIDAVEPVVDLVVATGAAFGHSDGDEKS